MQGRLSLKKSVGLLLLSAFLASTAFADYAFKSGFQGPQSNYKKVFRVISDVTNNNASANTIATVTGLSFPVVAGQTYNFHATIIYTAAASTTGSRWAVTGPASPTLFAMKSTYTIDATSETVNYVVAYDTPAASNASSLTAGNIAVLDGVIVPSASGTVSVRFASEVSASAIVAKAGSTLEVW